MKHLKVLMKLFTEIIYILLETSARLFIFNKTKCR